MMTDTKFGEHVVLLADGTIRVEVPTGEFGDVSMSAVSEPLSAAQARRLGSDLLYAAHRAERA